MDNDTATGREWAGLAVLALPTLLVSIDIFVLLLALPRLTHDLHASGTQRLWISDIYGFLLAGFLVTMGTLGDRTGRRRVLLTGAAAFGAAIGPIAGGLMLEHFWWGSVFLLAVPAMALLLILGPVVLPEYRDPAARRLDLGSVLLSLAAILPVAYALTETARAGLRPLPAAAGWPASPWEPSSCAGSGN